MPSKLDYVNARGTIIKKVAKLVTRVSSHARLALEQERVELELVNLQKWGEQSDDLHSKIIPFCLVDGDMDVEDDAAITLEDDITDIRTKLNRILNEYKATSRNTNSGGGNNSGSNSNDATVNVRLPYMEIPTFTGKFVEWASFHDLFVSVIHDNSKLSKSQKFQYLKKSLQGEASEVIRALALSDANYDVAWDLLQKRYDNKRHLISMHLDSLFGIRGNNESASELRSLLDSSREHIRSICGHNANTWDAVLVYLLTSKLGSQARTQWALDKPGHEYPSYADLDAFIEKRCLALMEGQKAQQPTSHAAQQSRRPASTQQQFQTKIQNSRPKGTSVYLASSSQHSTSASKLSQSTPVQKCEVCQSSHPLFRCQEFTKMGVPERREVVKKNNLCFNCLGSGHSVTQCYSTSSCKVCNAKHHTMIHDQKAPKDVPSVKSNFSASGFPVLLSTAEANVKNVFGHFTTVRVLLDNGSQASFVTESLVQALGLKRQRSTVHVKGIGNSGFNKSRGLVNLDIQSKVSGFQFALNVFILPDLTGFIPSDRIDNNYPHLQGLKLADPNFNTPGKIDILLGADIYNGLITEGRITYTDRPSAQNSHFGWLVSGPASPPVGGAEQTDEVRSHVVMTDVQDLLAKFWEQEELLDPLILTAEEAECEKHFIQNYTREETGRFVVALPFKNSSQVLGYSKEQAIRRWYSVERRLEANPTHRESYNKFMDEYLSMGHMQLIPRSQLYESVGKSFYFPHHFVLKETSTSTKFRVVFDGSAVTTTNTSLNDKLMVGPRLQKDIMDILMRFRTYKYVFTADIEKFFRQIKMRPEDCDFQRIVWRPSIRAPLEEYRLLTVTYGSAPAPFLSSRALQQLAIDEGDAFPLAKEVILRDFYVDDVMSGAHDIDTVLQLQSELVEILKLGELPLLKWASNCREVLENVPPEHRETKLPLLMEADDSVKALGLYWNPAADYFSFKVNLDPATNKVTKRTLLSDTAKLYDPLGWLAPAVINAKIMYQSLWKRQLAWDDELPLDLRKEWLSLRGELFELQQLKIKRQIINNINARHELHGFCDASERAYAAVVFLRTEDNNGVSVNIICSKTKVAPVKTESLPRLELCGAVLLARLLQRVSTVLNIQIYSITAWTDSTIVLAWLAGDPHRWETYVANRVAKVQGSLPRDKWRHVRSEFNPADCASRGLPPSELLTFNLWWTGPDWLRADENSWPEILSALDCTQPLPGERSVKSFITNFEFDLTKQYSSLSKLRRVTAFVFQFVNNCRAKKETIRTRLTTEDLHKALQFWVFRVQLQEFTTVFHALEDCKPVPHQFASLNLFIDSDGLLRVGGRLSHSSLPYQQKHPWLLPQHHPLTTLVIRHEHERLLHAGGQLTQASIMKTFWIVNAKRLVRSYIRRCIICFRHRASTSEQVMGDLPPSRLEPCRAFLRAGVDFGGPYTLKTQKGRGGKTYKAYICLFVCFTTKAIHIELVTELTTEAFLASLRRFIARRGRPTEMFSDNGTNFVGADNELKVLHQQFATQQHQSRVSDYLTENGIKWNFIPARAPHHGGLWEAGIKSAKQHLRKVIGESALTFEEMLTVLIQVEACLNSRPISPMSTDPNDLQALTPGHFLVGDALTAVPEPNLMVLSVSRLTRYQMIQHQLQHFWKRWSHEYLNTLQQRTKWKTDQQNIRIGDLALIKEDNLPPLKWMMARVIETHPGPDNKVRVLTLKTATSIIKRDIRRICKLPIDNC